MDNVNPDLIFDLAAGVLPAEEARAAEASLTPEGRRELAAQRAVLAAITATPPAAMTDIERARLHKTVAEGIADTTRELSPVAMAVPAVRPSPARRRSMVWVRLASAAAVAALFVGVVAVGSQLGSFGGSSDTGDVTADTAAARATTEGRESALSTTTAPAFAAGDSGGGDATITGGDGSQSDVVGESAPGLQEAPALTRAEDKEDLGEITAWLLESRRFATPYEDISTLPCYEVAMEDDDLAIVDGFSVEYPGPAGEPRPGIGFADSGTETADPTIRVYDAATCEPVLANSE